MSKRVNELSCCTHTYNFLIGAQKLYKSSWLDTYRLAKDYIKKIEENIIVNDIVNKPKWGMKQYLRDKNNQKCGFLCTKIVDGKVKVYYSFCDTRYDKFDPNYEPKELSFDVKTPYSQFENIIHFIKRVVRYYGKDETVTIPQWILNF